jgi:hypothetical protein
MIMRFRPANISLINRPLPASAAADPVLERQRQKQTPESVPIDRVAPYQPPLSFTSGVHTLKEVWAFLQMIQYGYEDRNFPEPGFWPRNNFRIARDSGKAGQALILFRKQ